MRSKRHKRFFNALIISFAVSFLMLLMLALYAIQQFKTLSDYSDQVIHTNLVLTELYKIDNIFTNVDALEKGFLITRDSFYLNQMAAQNHDILPQTAALKKLVEHNPKQMELLIQLRGLLAIRTSTIIQNIHTTDSFVSASQMYDYVTQSRDYKRQATVYINQMQSNEYKYLDSLHHKMENSEGSTERLTLLLLCIFFMLTAVLFSVMLRQLYMKRNYQYRLQSRLEELEQIREEREEIAYVLSHDIQEPLRKIQIFTNNIIQKNQDADKTELYQRIQANAARASDLVEDMQLLVGLKNENYENAIDLNQVVNKILKEINHKTAEVKQEMLPTVKGNQSQITLLFKAIIDNAIKFAKDNTPVIQISYEEVDEQYASQLTQKETGGYHKIIIADEGIGFDEIYADKIFQIFQRLHHKESQYKGKGIGLALARNIMNNHKGYITAEGKPGKGAIFNLYFPIEE